MSGAPPDRDRLKPVIAVTLAVLAVIGSALAVLERTAAVGESTYARETTRTAVRAMRASVALDGQRFDAEWQALRQRALATTRIAYNKRSTLYTTVIAVLAAALFLTGFALVVEGPPRHLSYAAGAGLGVFAVVWAVWLSQTPIPQTPPRAVSAAAQGAALASAGRPADAVRAYDRAVSADGAYAEAYGGRARSRLLVANPDFQRTGAFTDTTGGATAAGARDAERALDLDGQQDVLGLAVLGLVRFYRGDYAGALETARRVRATVGWRGLFPGTAVTAIVYERPLAGGAWVQPEELALFVSAAGAGRRRLDVPVRRVCRPTAVRVDLFLDGARAGSRTGPGEAASC